MASSFERRRQLRERSGESLPVAVPPAAARGRDRAGQHAGGRREHQSARSAESRSSRSSRRTSWPVSSAGSGRTRRKGRRVAARRVRLPAPVAAVPDVRHLRPSGHERHGRREKRLDRPDAGVDAPEQSVRVVAGRAAGRSREPRDERSVASRSICAYRIALARPPAKAEIGHRHGFDSQAVARRVHARASQPRRVRLHGGRACAQEGDDQNVASRDAAGTSGTAGNSCSVRAAASAVWRWRICSTAMGCWRRPPQLTPVRQPASGVNPYAPGRRISSRARPPSSRCSWAAAGARSTPSIPSRP